MPDETRKERRAPQVLATLAGVLAAFLLAAACYVGWQAVHILFPQNVYETALPAVVSDAIDADGVLLFDESYVAGSGTLGYLAADGERVSAGTAVAAHMGWDAAVVLLTGGLVLALPLALASYPVAYRFFFMIERKRREKHRLDHRGGRTE